MNTAAWPADRVERRAVGALVPYARNARTHSDAQVAQIAASIVEWGWTTPVLIDGDGILIAGHGRVLAAQRLGLAEVPVMVATGWTKAQIAAYRLADNKLALNAGWDNEQLKIELGELRDDEFELGVIGFDGAELDALFAEDDAPGGSSGAGSLAATFGVAPFSVLNAREGWWQDRKRAWLALGIQSELGRGDTPSNSACIGPEDGPTYRTIGGRKANTIPGGSALPLDRRANATPGGGKDARR